MPTVVPNRFTATRLGIVMQPEPDRPHEAWGVLNAGGVRSAISSVRRASYRSTSPVIEPDTDYERSGPVADVVFPSANDLRADGTLDLYYGAADRVIAAAFISLPVTSRFTAAETA